MTPEGKRRHYAAERVIYTAVKLEEAALLVRMRTEDLERRLRAAVDCGILPDDLKAMTRNPDGTDAGAIIDRVYREYLDDEFEVTGRDTVMYCLAHKRKVTWLPGPAWWIHDNDLPLTGSLGDPRSCASMWSAPSPIEVARKAAS